MKNARFVALMIGLSGILLLASGCQEGTCSSDKPYACEGTDFCCATLYLCGDSCVDDPADLACSPSNRVDCY